MEVNPTVLEVRDPPQKNVVVVRVTINSSYRDRIRRT